MIFISKIKKDISLENKNQPYSYSLKINTDFHIHQKLVEKIEKIDKEVYNLGKLYQLKASTLCLFKSVFNTYLTV